MPPGPDQTPSRPSYPSPLHSAAPPTPALSQGLVLLLPSSFFIFGCSRSPLLCRLSLAWLMGLQMSLAWRVGLLHLRCTVLRAVASLAEHGLWGAPSSAAAALRLGNRSTRPSLPCDTCSLPGPGIQPCPLHWWGDSVPLDH